MHRKYIKGVRAALDQMAGVKEAVTSADKKPQNVVGPDGRVRVRIVPVTKKSDPKEQMYQIPEDIPQNERTAFHGAAAAAAKAGKKSFNFGGKTHPVTMKKDVATKIVDQKEAKEEVEEMNISEKYRYTVDLYHKDHGTHDSFIKKAKAAGIKGAYSGVNKDGKVKVSLNHHDNSDGGVIHKFLKKHYDKDMTHGNMQTMQTGGSTTTKESSTNIEETNHVYVNDLNKGGLSHAKRAGMTVTHHGPSEFGHRATISHNDSKKLAKYVDRHLGGMDQVQKRTSTKEGVKESTIRERLLSIWEEAGRDKHYKGATKPEPTTKDDERSAKKMKDGHSVKKDDHEETSGAAEKSTKPSAMRGNDNKQGDKNIIPSATKDIPANKVKEEKNMSKISKSEYGIFGNKISNSLLKAYSVVEDYTHEFDVDPNGLKDVMSAAKKNGIKAKVHTMKGPAGGNPVVHLGHKDTNHMHKFIKKHYDPDYTKSDLNMHKL